MPNLTIYPYPFEDTCWVFDDERTGLKEEAFVRLRRRKRRLGRMVELGFESFLNS